MPGGALDLTPGHVVANKYRIERVLGQGGMGVVVAAKHIALNRGVALKFLRPELEDRDQNVERFAREARAMVQLTSEHTVRVLDVDRLSDGTPYLVMELLEGRTLEEALARRQGPFPVGEAVDFVMQACEAIGEAHALSIVHRDLKPGNLFLSRRADRSPLVKVLDFGLGKALDPSVAKALRSETTAVDDELTMAGSTFGSPAYMSPEQFVSTRDVDQRSDIWSLGVCLYELVTGRLPFVAPGVTLLGARIRKESATPPERIREEIPASLSAAILRCLEKDPAARFQTVAELAEAIEVHAPGAEVRAKQVTEALARSRNFARTAPELDERVTVPQPAQPAQPRHAGTDGAWHSGPRRERSGRGLLLVAGLASVVLGVAGAVAFVSSRSGVAGGRAERPYETEAGVPAAPPGTVSSTQGETTAATAPSVAPDSSAPEAPGPPRPVESSRSVNPRAPQRPPGARPVTHPGSDRF